VGKGVDVVRIDEESVLSLSYEFAGCPNAAAIDEWQTCSGRLIDD
jgi:hypothetical protein